MPYLLKNLKEIPNWLDCPFCGDYTTKQKHYLLNHFKKCEQYDGHVDDVLSYDMDDNFTVENYIEQQVNLINTMKEFIKTNELKDIESQTIDEILLYIKNKLLNNRPLYYKSSYSDIDIHSCDIYEFFFGKSEELEKRVLEEYCRFLQINQ